MTDAEKIEWLSATNKALMESQERLAGEIVELRKLAYLGEHHFPDLTWKARFGELLEDNKKLREVLAEARRWVGSEPMGFKGCQTVEQIHKNIDKVLG